MTETAHARTTDPETSHEAAGSVDVRRSQAQVLTLLQAGPVTDEELAKRAYMQGVQMSASGLRSRRAELVEKGLVEHSGEYKKTRAGRRTRVWRVPIHFTGCPTATGRAEDCSWCVERYRAGAEA